MVEPAPLVAATAGFASALAFGYVGLLLARRPLPPRHRAAGRALALAWIAASAHSAIAGFAGLASGALPAGALIVLAWAMAAIGIAMIAGVVAYLVYLLTGNRYAVPIVAASYAAQFLALAAVLVRLQPVGTEATGWMLRFSFAQGETVGAWITVAFLAPACVAAIAYLAMIAEARDPTTRWRICLVGGGLVVWSLAALATRFPPLDAWVVFARVAGALLAVAVVLAYEPPAWARARWGIASVRGEIAARPLTPEEREARRAALATRANELV